MKKDKRFEKYLKLQQENKELKKLIKSYGKLIFNQAELINKIQFDINQEKIDKARKYLKEREEDNMCCSVCSVMSDELLEILGDKE